MDKMNPVAVLILYAGFIIGSVHGNAEIGNCTFNPKCTCWSDAKSLFIAVDCSNKGLRRLQSFPNLIDSLDLHGNIISVLDSVFQYNDRLTTLDLSSNVISILQENSFKGLINLVSLNLRNNRLNNGHLSFMPTTFSFLKNLKYLNMKNNYKIPYQPDLSYVTSLQSLSMDLIDTGFTVLNETYRNLHNLKVLDLSGSTGNCFLTILTNETFQYTPDLQYIDISGCRLQLIYKETFLDLKNITHLDISNNTCLKFTVLENVTHDLQFSSIKTLKLNKIHKAFDMNTLLRRSQVQYLQNTSLENVYIGSNRIQLIEKGAFSYMPPTLEYIYADRNAFSIGPYLTDIITSSVKKVDISYLFSSYQEDRDPVKCVFQQDGICNLQCPHDSRVKRQEFLFHEDDKNNTLSQMIPFPVPFLPYQLQKLNFSFSKYHFVIEKTDFNKNNLEILDMSNNFFVGFIGPLVNLQNLSHLNMSSNLCSNLSRNFFHTDFKNLHYLNMENNLLGLVLWKDESGEIFQNLRNVLEINLSQNRISYLPKQIFKSQINIIRLDLSNNFLEDIDFDVDQMKHLTYLNLKDNRISYLNTNSRGQLSSLANIKKNFTINLSGNRFVCNCESIDLFEWMSNFKDHLYNIEVYTCQKNVFIGDINTFYDSMRKKCRPYATIAIGIGALVLIFIFILCTGIVFRFRWKLRYLYYMVKIRFHDDRLTLDTTNGNKYIYDAFVSYADEDQSFVHNKMLQKLETENGIKLCLHKRNFLPGNDIATNICSSIQNSRKVLVVLSRSFLMSYWCMFEYNMARMESIYERKRENILCIIFLEQIPARDLPLHVMEHIHSKTYIEYPNDEHGDPIFWDQLKQALIM